MIVFDLRCPAGHVFEAWFGSSTAYEVQRAQGLVVCPMCGDTGIEKAVMAPNVAAKGNQRPDPVRAPAPPVAAGAAPVPPAAAEAGPPPEMVKAAMAALATLQARMLEKSQWVGSAFADRARAMHLGDEPAATIHGQTTPEQARELIEEGVPVTPLILPVVPPEACN